MEIWKVCYEDYEISNLGNCRRKQKNNEYKSIKGCIGNRGYRYFQVQRNNKRINFLFHTLVAEQFIGERPTNFVIDHIDRNKLNNNYKNLRYITQEENIHNSSKYRTDLPKDKVIRRRIINHEYAIKIGKCKKIRKSKYNDIPKKNSSDRLDCKKCNKNFSRRWFNKHKCIDT